MQISSIEIEKLNNYEFIISIDEAGRGPLAGPVTIAGILLDNESIKKLQELEYLNDSKKISSKKRLSLKNNIKNIVLSYEICNISVEIIDKVNIYEATKIGILNVFQKILNKNENIKKVGVLIDGKFSKLEQMFYKYKNINYNIDFVIKGDSLCPSIAAASILAKTYRDEYMINIHEIYPLYEFKKHKGYGTKLHLEKINLYGPSNIHRKSFEPVKTYLKNKSNKDINIYIKYINLILDFINKPFKLDNKKIEKKDKLLTLYYEIGVEIENPKYTKIHISNIIKEKFNVNKKSISYIIKTCKRVKQYIDIIGKNNAVYINITITNISTMNNKLFKNFINDLEYKLKDISGYPLICAASKY
jgi:ribonuclease HII